MRRYYVLQGDPTAAGGTVLEGLLTHTYNGIGVAYHGALISCRSCKATGRIHCVPPRRPFTLCNGQQIAMEGDLCLCRCPRPPKLMATQRTAWMGFESEEGPLPVGSTGAAAWANELNTAPNQPSEAKERETDRFSERLMLIDPITGEEATQNYAFVNRLQVVKKGASGADGLTEQYVRDEKENLTVVLGDSFQWQVSYQFDDSTSPAAIDNAEEAENE